MNKYLKHIGILLSVGTLLVMCFPINSQAAESDLQRFLDWYSEHKDVGGEYFLDSELNLCGGTQDTPILLDGTGDITLYCNQYSLVVQSDVIIDNKNLFVSSVNNEEPAVILNDTKARLTLKNGTISARSTIGLSVSDGVLICPQGEDRFTISSWLEAPAALMCDGTNITLSNLDLYASGTQDVTGVKGGSNAVLENCRVSVEGSGDGGTVIGVQAENSIRLSCTSVTAKGRDARSVVCSAGVQQIVTDSACSFEPEYMIPPESDATYRVTSICNPVAVNVPIGMSPEELKLPDALECEMLYTNDDANLKENRTITVTWNTDNLIARLREEGESVISGTFSTTQLAEEKIYMPAAFQPTITLRVMSVTVMNRIWFSRIEPNQEPPFVEIYMVRPYRADRLFIEYSSDGILWERGYGIRTADNCKELNMLLCSTAKEPSLTVPVYLSNLAEGGRIRAVVEGGPFAGTWEPVVLDSSELFTPPGEDGKGGDRGGQSLPASEDTYAGSSERTSQGEVQSSDTAGVPVFSDENTQSDNSVQHDFSYKADDEKAVIENGSADKTKVYSNTHLIKRRGGLLILIVVACAAVMIFAAGRIFKKRTGVDH